MVNKTMSDVLNNVLSDVISAVTILEVVNNTTIEGGLASYIKTDNLDTVNRSLLEEITYKHSDEKISVKFLIPETKFINYEHVENTDTVSIFIVEVS
jgi:hypothetical protein